MTDEPNPERVAGDDAERVKHRLEFADRAETLLRYLLHEVGFERGSGTAAVDLLAALTSWLDLLRTALRDPIGQFAGLWWRAHEAALARCQLLTPAAARQWAAEEADCAVLAFARRYPPLIEDAPRDTIADLDALRAELDRQTEIAGEAMTRATSAERLYRFVLENQRGEVAIFNRVAHAVGVPDDLDRSNWAAWIIETYSGNDWKGRAEEAEAKAERLEAVANAAEERAEKAERELAELRAAAIVPLAKPERADVGQRWALLVDVAYTHYSSVKDTRGASYTQKDMRRSDAWIYLGNAPTSEG